MTAAEIKEYLGMCIELEKESYTQKRAMNWLYKQMCLLGNHQNFKEPEKPEKTRDDRGVNGGCVGEALAAAGAASTLFALLIQSDFFLICGIGALIIGGVVFLFGVLVYKDDYRIAVREYNKAVERHKELVAADARRVDAECVKKAALDSNFEVLQAANEKTTRCLKNLYNKNVLYPKYRTYACVCTLYEYFASGRCTQLEGHEGAYNILESEMRLNRIITQNDRILENLETIKSNQELLYDSIQESNRKADQIILGCAQMSSQLNGIQAQGTELNARIADLQTTSDLNLYVNTCAKRELEYMNRANRIF